MRKAILLFITLLTAFSACTKRSEETLRLLKQADEWAYASPDTVLNLLKGLTEKDLQNKDDYYYYYLLGTEACMKKYYAAYDTLAISVSVREILPTITGNRRRSSKSPNTSSPILNLSE
ncbi:MAG: hypothetical protein IJ456_07975 [Bacteroides sp.]|nr:hypothetical protein [Bacteroides sp.]